MKIQTIIRPNQKGQIVIPKAVRKQLGIDSKSQLHLITSGTSLIITLLDDLEFPKIAETQTYADVLAETKGSWAGDPWLETEKAREKNELSTAEDRKQSW